MSVPRFGDQRDWFFEARYGLFLHWGVYAVPAWQEQHRLRMKMTRADYRPLMHEFNPEQFDPDAWLDIAEGANMRYLVFTAKHIDGFCMWDSKLTDYTIMNTPYGRDIVAMLAEACHRRNFPLSIYYSVVDGDQPNYPYDGRPHEMIPGDDDTPDWDTYIEYVRGQVRELCTNYGELHGFWWDANSLKHHDPSINAMIRELQPKAVINNRGFDEGDFGTPERDWDASVDQDAAFDRRVEACQSIGFESWGYKSDEDYYTDRHILASIDKVLAKGGNYLLNVGPMADGTLPPEAVARLARFGAWYLAVQEAFDGTEPAPGLIDDRNVLLTRRGTTLYVHLTALPVTDRVLLKPLDVAPKRATLLNTGEPVETVVNVTPWQWKEGKPYLRIRRLPVNDLAATVPVVKLEFDELPG